LEGGIPLLLIYPGQLREEISVKPVKSLLTLAFCVPMKYKGR